MAKEVELTKEYYETIMEACKDVSEKYEGQQLNKREYKKALIKELSVFHIRESRLDLLIIALEYVDKQLSKHNRQDFKDSIIYS